MNIDILLVFLYSYFLGSIPFGLILTKLFLREDIRKIGSGNIGATNVLRTGKKFLAIMTLLLDIIKGFLTVYFTSVYFSDLVYLAALICFIGHIYPVWLKFKGGKGVAVYLGILFSLSINLSIIFIVSWLLILFFFKYSSLSSLISTLCIFIYSMIFKSFNESIFFFIIFIIITYTHRENITRLKNKNEIKIKI